MELLTHLVKSSVFLFLFYLFYRVLLRRTTFFHINRAYLLIALILSPLIPFLSFEERVLVERVSSENQNTVLTYDDIAFRNAAGDQKVVGTNSFLAKVPVDRAIYFAYIAGVLFFLGKLFYRLFLVMRVVRSHPAVIDDQFPVVVMPPGHEAAGSFSFFNRILMSRNDFDFHFDTVYRHEKVHVMQRHSFDVLLVECLTTLFWFNPLMKFYKSSLQEIHEFLADKSARDKEGYARFLVSYALSGGYTHQMGNSFSSSFTLKRRVEMLFKKRDSNLALVRYVLVLPIAVLAIVLTASRNYVYVSDSVAAERHESSEDTPTSANDTDSEVFPIVQQSDRKVSGKVLGEAGQPLSGATVVLEGGNKGTTTDKEGYFSIDVPTGSDILVVSYVGFRSRAVTVPEKNKLEVVLEKVSSPLEEVVILGYGSVFLKPGIPADSSSDRSVVEAMPEFPGGNKELYRFLARNIRYPGEAGRANVQGKVLVSFVVNKLGHIRNPRITQSVGFGLDEEALRVVISMPRWTPGRQNGEPVDVEYTLPVAFKLETAGENETRQGRVKSEYRGDVGLDSSSLRPYFPTPGEQVIELKSESGYSIKHKDGEKPLYLVNGKEVYSIESLDSSLIESIEVRKGNEAMAKFGEKAKNGVILISLKDGKK